jgi:N-acetylglucosaminyldiphosphoundecaprenol N-acetyl-beta-D-mannosaminyltransferase
VSGYQGSFSFDKIDELVEVVMADCVPNSISILGAPVSIFNSYDDAVQLIRQRISSRRPTFCVAINPEKVFRAKREPRLSRVLNSAQVQICDGVGISLASMLLYRRLLPRCTGIDLFLRLIRVSAEEGWKVFLLGASPQSNAAACRFFVKTYPSLKIVGSQDGYFKDSSTIVERINESGADLLFVAMGTPRQEFWISEHMPRLRVPFCMGVGGSLDIVAGSAKRAPALFRKTGMEWFFRLLAEPDRLRRQMALPLFTMEILRALVAARKRDYVLIPR